MHTSSVRRTPVAGGPTIDAKTAAEVTGQLQPRVIIPMHYSTAATSARMAARGAAAGGQPGKAADPAAPGRAPAGRGPSMTGVDDFLKALDPSVKVEQAGHQITIDAGKLPAQRTVYVMKYE